MHTVASSNTHTTLHPACQSHVQTHLLLSQHYVILLDDLLLQESYLHLLMTSERERVDVSNFLLPS